MSMIDKLAEIIDPVAFMTMSVHLSRTHKAQAMDHARRKARAVLLALREPDEGMVEAMYASGAEGDPKQVASDFTAAIDHILNESGQPANPT